MHRSRRSGFLRLKYRRSLTTQVSVTRKWQLWSRLRYDTSREDIENKCTCLTCPWPTFASHAIPTTTRQTSCRTEWKDGGSGITGETEPTAPYDLSLRSSPSVSPRDKTSRSKRPSLGGNRNHPVYKVTLLLAIIKPCILGECCPCPY